MVILASLPSRERGLKLLESLSHPQARQVAPFAGAWIETLSPSIRLVSSLVAPFAGAWIETLEIFQSPAR